MMRISQVPMWTALLGWMIIGTAAPALYLGLVRGVADVNDMHIHDEHGYLLQADTFASGRLTNPPPSHPEFFESPYILVSPTYQAKYPPAQAVFLAIGQRLLGHPIWGVWLSSGAFTAALYWMLCGWANRRWAPMGTLHSVVVLGTSYWASSYWGGMVAALGGALVLGGTCWTIRRGRAVYGLATGLGAVILANSRPYEGLLVCLACAPALAWWLCAGSTQEPIRKRVAWCAAFALLAAAGTIASAAYNRAVTGDCKTLPWALYQRQYNICGPFRWQRIDQIPERHLETRLRAFFEEGDDLCPGKPGGPPTGVIAALREAREPLLKAPAHFLVNFMLLRSAKRWYSPSRVLEYASFALTLVALVWLLCSTKRVGLLHAALGLHLLTVAGAAAVWWDSLHYRAPAACIYYFLSVMLARRLAVTSPGTLLPRSIRPRQLALAFGLLSVILPLAIAAVGRVPDNWLSHLQRRISSGIEQKGTYALQTLLEQGLGGQSRSRPSDGLLSRAQLIRTLSENERPALVFVSYAPDVTVHFEWVYNLSDLASQKVLLVHDLGDEHNHLLIAEFPNRDVWRVQVTPGGAMLIRYDFQPPPVPEGSTVSQYGRAD